MKISKPTVRPGSMPVATWAGTKALVLSLLMGSASAFAVAPPADTKIGNTASASFVDSTGITSAVTSNQVVTLVQQVGSMTLDGQVGAAAPPVVFVKTTTAGSTVYAPHTLINTGNGTDVFTISVQPATTSAPKFTRISVYADNGSGQSTGAALCSVTTTSACITPAASPISVAGSGGQFKFVVAYEVPASASAAPTVYETATVTATPTLAALYGTNNSAAVKDQITIGSGAVFVMYKSIAAPSTLAPQSLSWPTPVTGGPASTAQNCPVVWGANVATTAGCRYTVYTLTISNIGTATGTFAFRDVLPSGLSYVAGSAVWSSSGTTALGDGPGADPSQIDYQVSSKTIVGVISSFASGAAQSVSFVVLVNPGVSKGNSTTGNTAFYNSADSPSATALAPGTLNSQTGTSNYNVNGNFAVAIGNASSTAGSAADTTAGQPTGAQDTATVNSAVVGDTVKFPMAVFNTGDTVDTFNLAVKQSTFPADTVFVWYGADGATPLQDTGHADNTRDTGQIQPNGNFHVVLGAILPKSAVFGTQNYNVIVAATSAADFTKSDTTKGLLVNVSPGLVDMTNTTGGSSNPDSGDIGAGPSLAPTTVVSTTANVAAKFDLFVKNNEAGLRTYSLAASAANSFSPAVMPPDWQVKFFSGAGVTCNSPSPITTINVAANSQVAVIACITPPASQTAIAGVKIYFQVLGTGGGLRAADVKLDAVTVTASATANYFATLTGTNTATVAAGSTVYYSHILTNTGSQSCGAYTLIAAIPQADYNNGWRASVYSDADGTTNYSAGDQLISETTSIGSPFLLSGVARKYLVRIDAPFGLSPGASVTATLTANFGTANTSCGTPSVIDYAVVTAGVISVVKTQAIDSHCLISADAPPTVGNLTVIPGQCIFYRVVATNKGASPVGNLTISDSAPGYTTFPTSTSNFRCSAVGGTTSGSFVIGITAGPSVSCGSGSAANVINSNGTVTLEYSVVVEH